MAIVSLQTLKLKRYNMVKILDKIKSGRKIIDTGLIISTERFGWCFKRGYNPAYSRSGGRYISDMAGNTKQKSVYIPFFELKKAAEAKRSIEIYTKKDDIETRKVCIVNRIIDKDMIDVELFDYDEAKRVIWSSDGKVRYANY